MDYKRIIENLDVAAVKDLLERMDIPFQDKGDYLICKTACHNIDLDNSACVVLRRKDPAGHRNAGNRELL